MLSLLFCLPNQIITLLLDNVAKEIPSLKEELEKISEEVPYLKNKINFFISAILCNALAHIYEQTSSYFASEDLKDNILKYEALNKNEQMQKILSYSRFNDIKYFLKEVASYCNSRNSDAIFNNILKIVTKNILYIRNIKIDFNIRCYIDSIFKDKQERVTLISTINKDE